MKRAFSSRLIATQRKHQACLGPWYNYCLSSEHTGGEVHLLHGGKDVVLSTAPDSPFDFSALAWYSDVQHEIKPVESGYRLVLTYNLIQNKSQAKQSAAALDTATMELGSLLSE